MGLDIDITDKYSDEIIEILETYPKGHLEIKFERVFWISDSSEPRLPRCSPGSPPGNRRDSLLKEPTIGERFQKMSDVLGSMVGPPQPTRRR